MLRDSLEDSLQAHNYNTLTASGGIEAISLYTQHRTNINIVLIDLLMESLDGATTIRVLKAINPQLPIIAMSGLPLHEVGYYFDMTGIQGFLLKPFTTQQLLRAIATPKLE